MGTREGRSLREREREDSHEYNGRGRDIKEVGEQAEGEQGEGRASEEGKGERGKVRGRMEDEGESRRI